MGPPPGSLHITTLHGSLILLGVWPLLTPLISHTDGWCIWSQSQWCQLSLFTVGTHWYKYISIFRGSTRDINTFSLILFTPMTMTLSSITARYGNRNLFYLKLSIHLVMAIHKIMWLQLRLVYIVCLSERKPQNVTTRETRTLPQVPEPDSEASRPRIPVDRPRLPLPQSDLPRTSGEDDGLLV